MDNSEDLKHTNEFGEIEVSKDTKYWFKRDLQTIKRAFFSTVKNSPFIFIFTIVFSFLISKIWNSTAGSGGVLVYTLIFFPIFLLGYFLFYIMIKKGYNIDPYVGTYINNTQDVDSSLVGLRVSEKRRVILFMIVAVDVLMVAGLILAVFQQTRSKSNEETNTRMQIVNSPSPSIINNKTYKNETYGFEFQYDQDSTITKEEIVDTTNSKDLTVHKDKYYAIELEDFKNINVMVGRNKDTSYFGLVIRDKSNCSFTPYGGTVIQQKTVNIAGQQTEYYEFTNVTDFNTFRACITDNGKSYDFIAGYPNEASKGIKDKVRNNFDQILQTFKFTN